MRRFLILILALLLLGCGGASMPPPEVVALGLADFGKEAAALPEDEEPDE